MALSLDKAIFISRKSILETMSKMAQKLNYRLWLTIILLSLYVLTWIGILTVPLLNISLDLKNQLTSWLLISEEFLILGCAATAFPLIVLDIRNKIDAK